MKLAIVGSFKLNGNAEAQALIEAALDKYKPTLLISGGCDGIDVMAENTAKSRGIPCSIHKPSVWKWDAPGGFKERNNRIADECDALVRIVASSTTTYGSGYTRDRAKAAGKPTENYVVDV